MNEPLLHYLSYVGRRLDGYLAFNTNCKHMALYHFHKRNAQISSLFLTISSLGYWSNAKGFQLFWIPRTLAKKEAYDIKRFDARHKTRCSMQHKSTLVIIKSLSAWNCWIYIYGSLNHIVSQTACWEAWYIVYYTFFNKQHFLGGNHLQRWIWPSIWRFGLDQNPLIICSRSIVPILCDCVLILQ